MPKVVAHQRAESQDGGRVVVQLRVLQDLHENVVLTRREPFFDIFDESGAKLGDEDRVLFQEKVPLLAICR